jgi:hypothetical protein
MWGALPRPSERRQAIVAGIAPECISIPLRRRSHCSPEPLPQRRWQPEAGFDGDLFYREPRCLQQLLRASYPGGLQPLERGCSGLS